MRIKICGITRVEDGLAAASEGVDYVGLVFAAGSPRRVEWEQARRIADAVHRNAPETQVVGVFVNQAAQTVLEAMDYCELDFVQLHGREPAEWLRPGGALCGRAYKAIRPRSIEEGRVLAAAYGQSGLPELPDLLIDTYDPRVAGGTGKPGDPAIATDLARRRRVMLAGGLDPRTVRAAALAVRPWGVDVSSGVEAAPGIKDHHAIRTFVRAAREAGYLAGNVKDDAESASHEYHPVTAR